jgi:hypothetical protein
MVTVEQCIVDAKEEMQLSLTMLVSFLEMGESMLGDAPLDVRVDYQSVIVFKTMLQLCQGNYRIPRDWEFLNTKQKNKRLKKLCSLILKDFEL